MADEKNPAVLKKQRGIVKGGCTRIKNYVDSVRSINPSVRAQLEERRVKLDEYWSEYNTVQSRLETLDEAEANDRVAFEEAFYVLCGKIREMLSSSTVTRSTSVLASTSSGSHATN